VHFGYSLPHGDVLPKERWLLHRMEEYRRLQLRRQGQSAEPRCGSLSGVFVGAPVLPEIHAHSAD